MDFVKVTDSETPKMKEIYWETGSEIEKVTDWDFGMVIPKTMEI